MGDKGPRPSTHMHLPPSVCFIHTLRHPSLGASSEVGRDCFSLDRKSLMMQISLRQGQVQGQVGESTPRFKALLPARGVVQKEEWSRHGEHS